MVARHRERDGVRNGGDGGQVLAIEGVHGNGLCEGLDRNMILKCK
jgi:hypothetical protein